ncbi:MAG: hypothetical protein ABI927_00505 [Gaiellaceae bacterium]
MTKHPYRHAAIAHGILAIVILGLGWATSSHVGRAMLMALGYFVLATSWTWWRYRERERRDAREADAK